MAYVTGEQLSPDSATFIMPAQMPVLMAVGILTALLFAVAIFMYKNTSRQRTMTLVALSIIHI